MKNSPRYMDCITMGSNMQWWDWEATNKYMKPRLVTPICCLIRRVRVKVLSSNLSHILLVTFMYQLFASPPAASSPISAPTSEDILETTWPQEMVFLGFFWGMRYPSGN